MTLLKSNWAKTEMQLSSTSTSSALNLLTLTNHYHHKKCSSSSSMNPKQKHHYPLKFILTSSLSNRYPPTSTSTATTDGVDWYENDLGKYFDDDGGGGGGSGELRRVQFKTTAEVTVDVKELQELPENWRRSKLAWLCKELPSHKTPTITRLLSANKKWIRQEDATYLAVHCMRIRENQPAFSVYKWMIQQHWFRFDFALATKLADYMGREKKFSKAREIFDDIISQGRVPSESTFHILTVAYLSATGEDCLREACEMYNRMIHLGAYRPLLSLHNALFRAIVSKPATFAKQYLKQAEFIYHNLLTCGFEIHKDIYGGLLWLHSYQDIPDTERILYLRKEMHQQGVEETRDTLLSLLRACSKDGDVDEAEKTWSKLLKCEDGIPSQAYVYKMQVHAMVGNTDQSLRVFRDMQEQLKQGSVVAYHKIIEVMCNALEVELAESLMKELITANLKPLTPSYLDLLNMYFKLSLHDRVESTFLECLQKCRPNQTIYSVYLDSLVQTSSIVKAECIFSQMLENDAIGVSSRSCNTLLSGYLLCRDLGKAEKLYGFMREKNYEVEASLMEKLELVLSNNKKVVQNPVILKLTPEQREILVGLLLGGIRVEYSEDTKKHFVRFEFKEDSDIHFVLKRHIYHKYHEWLQSSNYSAHNDDDNKVPSKFLTVPHTAFSFYADQFWPNGSQSIPKLIHRWLSTRALAYWFMYGGYRTRDGNFLLKLKGSKGDVERVFKALKTQSLEFRVKQKGNVFWVGFLESHSTCFWRVIQPYVLDEYQDSLAADGQPLEKSVAETSSLRFGKD